MLFSFKVMKAQFFHALPGKQNATNVPDKASGLRECNNLILKGELEKEPAG
jgi:hypothetical protein